MPKEFKRETWGEFAERIGFDEHQTVNDSDDIDTVLRKMSTYIYWSSVHVHEQHMNHRRHAVRIKRLLTNLLHRIPQ